ncbi:radical SAM protein [Polymorphobacter sp.]|uniref:radical SAM protein n=1 Tax=Polymorphobacter sp. TaxID=1909290 RepID=UPI003F6EB4F1
MTQSLVTSAPDKFRDPQVTARGERRAQVALVGLETLWFNTGTLCNLACKHCYIESSPTNDALVYLRLAEMMVFLDEAAQTGLPLREIGFTGGEPFMNPEMVAMIAATQACGHDVLVLTNAMRPMRRFEAALAGLRRERLTFRVSLDHHSRAVHDAERGAGSFDKALDGLCWLVGQGFAVAVAGRHLTGEDEATAREGYARLFAGIGMACPPLVLFPEMDAAADVPEISTGCWEILGVRPQDQMCSHSRMVVKRRGADRPVVLACTLIADRSDFEMGETLAEASAPVALNHPHCARFCVLGGASCSG